MSSIQMDATKTMAGAGRRFHLHVSFETRSPRTVLYGPSGAGKSLTLQMLGGLLKPDEGRVAFQGRTLYDGAAGVDVPARERRFGYLFQDYALFPHLTVRQNIAFALAQGWRNPSPRGEAPAVRRWLTAFELQEVAGQYPHQLSGGQRQRTALARALVNEPVALLLDEPFSALDPELREKMRQELDALIASVGIPVLMITHDPQDLDRFGETVLRLRDGRLVS